MKKLITALLLTFFCADANALPPQKSASDAERTTYAFISEYLQKRPHDLQSALGFSKYFTKDFRQDFKTALAAEKASIAATPANEKPCLWEGDVFFGVYEGANSYKVDNITTENNGKKTATLRLFYKEAAQKPFEWAAIIYLTNQNGNWLIEDIYDTWSRKNLAETLKANCADE